MPGGPGSVDPAAPAVIGPEGSVWSYAELRDRLETRGASSTASEGRVPLPGIPEDAGDHEVRLSFVEAQTTPEGLLHLLQLWRLGRVPVPLNPRLTPPERQRAAVALDGARLPGGAAVVLWTSGTSGQPRGVALSMENLQASARAAAERLELGPSDVWIASLSSAHVGGLALLTRSLILGSAVVMPGPLDAARLSVILDGGDVLAGTGLHPTHLSLVPTQLHRLLDARAGAPAPPGLRCVLVGGAHAPRALVERAHEDGWPVALTYGATEMSSQVATALPREVRDDPGTVGRPLPGVEVRIAQDGEILARGPTRALGYVGDGESGSLADADGWYATGDIGSLDADGRLRVEGRRIDRIVSGGVTVDAVEVEDVLRAHPSVRDACVVGLPDETWGERIGAWIVPVHAPVDLPALEAWLRSRLSSAKRPRAWHQGDELPRNANGKVRRGEVRSFLDRGRTSTPESG